MLQQQISDLVMGKHKRWHLYALRTSTYGELGREFLIDQPWEFIGGFDSETEAFDAKANVTRTVEAQFIYGGDDFVFAVKERA